MSSNLVQYGSWDVEVANKEQEDLDKSMGSGFMKMKVGKNTVRFLPPPVGVKSPFRVIYQHYIKQPGDESGVSFTCPKREAKKECPVCAAADNLRTKGNDEDYKRSKELYPKRRVHANVINRAEPEKGPQVMAFGSTIHDQLLKLRRDPDAGGDYTHPEKGFDIIIDRKGTTKNDTEYKVFAARQNSPLGDMEWIRMQVDLERFATVKTAEEIREALGMPNVPAPSEKQVNDAPRGTRRTAQDDASEDIPF